MQIYTKYNKLCKITQQYFFEFEMWVLRNDFLLNHNFNMDFQSKHANA